MADATVTLKLSATEYRFLRSELELHAKDLKWHIDLRNRVHVDALSIKDRTDMRKREASLREILKGI